MVYLSNIVIFNGYVKVPEDIIVFRDSDADLIVWIMIHEAFDTIIVPLTSIDNHGSSKWTWHLWYLISALNALELQNFVC